MSEQPHDPTGLSYYGSDMTIHGGGDVNVELDAHGDVVAVWFRCRLLRFTQSSIRADRARNLRAMYEEDQPPPLDAVVFREPTDE